MNNADLKRKHETIEKMAEAIFIQRCATNYAVNPKVVKQDVEYAFEAAEAFFEARLSKQKK